MGKICKKHDGTYKSCLTTQERDCSFVFIFVKYLKTKAAQFFV